MVQYQKLSRTTFSVELEPMTYTQAEGHCNVTAGGELLEPRNAGDFLEVFRNASVVEGHFRVDGKATDDCYYDKDGNPIEGLEGLEEAEHLNSLTMNLVTGMVQGFHRTDEMLGVLCQKKKVG